MLRDDLYRKVAAFLVLDLLLWSIAGLGVAQGRRWGFAATSVLLALDLLGAATRLLVGLPTFWTVVEPLLWAAALVYCLVRFGALRPAPRVPRAFR